LARAEGNRDDLPQPRARGLTDRTLRVR